MLGITSTLQTMVLAMQEFLMHALARLRHNYPSKPSHVLSTVSVDGIFVK